MSWKYPEHPIKPSDVVEIDDLNRNLGEFAQELSGGLNEHNWKKDSFNSQDCADDVAMQVFGTRAGVNNATDPETAIGDFYRLKSSHGWFPIESGLARAVKTNRLSIEATTPSCVLWVMASFQHHQKFAPSRGQAQYAIRVDGTVIPESITGGASAQTDQSHLFPTNIHNLPQGYSTLGFDAVIPGAGINQFYRSVSLDTMVPVTAGTHTVEIVARTVGVTDPRMKFYVGAREMFIIAMEK